MQYKIVKNDMRKTDCERCMFVEKCGSICPLGLGFYFSDIHTSEPDYISKENKGLFINT